MIIQELINKIEYGLVNHLKSENEYVHFISLLYGILSKINKNHPEFMIHQNIIKSIELLKASTLIIDDIIDGSNKRNNDNTFINKFGINNSILIGEQLKSHSTISFIENLNKLDTSEEAKMKAILSFEDSYRTVIQGQLYDINFLVYNPMMVKWGKSDWEKYIKEYFNIIYKTTSVFLQIPFFVTFHLGFIDNNDSKSIYNYFKHMGVAYQVRDDIIDAVGLEEDIGREQGGDILEKKIRIPLIYFFLHCEDLLIKKEVGKLLSSEILSKKDVLKIIDYLYEKNIINLAIKKLNNICDIAINQTRNIKDEKIKLDLINLVEFLKL